MGKNDLKRAFRKGLGKKQDKILEVNAVLGDSAGNVRVAGTNNQVWVRIGGNRTAEKAINDIAPLQPGRAVRLTRDGWIWRVKGTITGSGTGTGTSTGVDRHGFDHYWMAKDPVLVHLRQITALRVEVVSGMNILINGGTLVIRNRPIFVAQATYDLTTFLPTADGMSKVLLVSISPAGLVTFTQSAEFAHAALSDTQYTSVPIGHFPLAAVRLYYGQTVISENKLATDIRDLRVFVNPVHKASHAKGGDDALSITDLDVALDDSLNVTTTHPGLAPTAPNDTDLFLDGTGQWAEPPKDATSLMGRDLAIPNAPQNGDGFLYDEASGTFILQAAGGGGGGSVTVETIDEGTVIENVTTLQFPTGRVSSGGTGIAQITMGTETAVPIETTTQDIKTEILLCDTTLGANASTLGMSNIPTGYEALHIKAFIRTTRAAAGGAAFMFYNGDTTQVNYLSARQYGGNTHGGDQNAYPVSSSVPSANSPVNEFGLIEVLVFDYAGTKIKNAIFHNGSGRYDSGKSYDIVGTQSWKTDAINQLYFKDSDGSSLIAAGSHIQVYGIKTLNVVTSVTGVVSIAGLYITPPPFWKAVMNQSFR